MLRMADLLKRHCVLPETALSWEIIAQASSIGSLGKRPEDWLLADFLNTLASSSSSLNVVFSSKNNVIGSYYGEKGAGCLPYREEIHNKQKWLENYL